MSATRPRRTRRSELWSRRVLAMFCTVLLVLAACGSDEPEAAVAQAEESLAPAEGGDSGDTTVDTGSAGDGGATADDGATSSGSADASGDAPAEQTGLDDETVGDRGLRLEGEENPESVLPDPTASPVPPTPVVEPTPAPTATPTPENVSVEPTPTPTPTPTPPPQNDPVGQPPAQLPTGPVPSDDLVVEGPPTDDGSDIEIISDAGILACATTEAAIEFLDRGDLTRTEEALQSAGALASSASESAISALASQLSAVGRDGDAAFDAIVAMLSACAQYGYEV